MTQYNTVTVKQLPVKSGPDSSRYSREVSGFDSRLMMLHANNVISTITADCRLSFMME